jgi:hypothetical protein
MYQLTNFSDSDFAEKTAKNINKSYGNVASVTEIILKVLIQEQTSMDSVRFIPIGTKVSACFITDSYWEFCKDHVLKNCRLKINPLTK